MPRVTPNYDPQQPTLTPAQQVAGNPYVPKLKEPTLLPVKEFAELSGVVADLTVQQAQKQNEVEQQAGEQDYMDELSKAHKALDQAEGDKKQNQSDFLKAEKAGTITPAQNPWRKVGYNQAAARDIMSAYQSDLIAAQGRATATRDQNGQLVPATPIDQVIQDVWKKYADNPLLRTFEGSKVTVQHKAAADDAFRQGAAQELAKNQAKETQDSAANSIYTWTLANALGKEPLTPEKTAKFDEVVNAFRLQGVNTRDATWTGVTATVDHIASADDSPESAAAAAQALRNMRALKVGTTTLGQDAEFSAKIDTKIANLEAQQDARATKKVVGQEAQLKLDSLQVRRDFLARVEQEKKNNGGHVDVVQVAREMGQEILDANQYGDNRDLIRRTLDDYARSSLTEDSKNRKDDILGLVRAGASVEDAHLAMNVAITNHELSFDDIQDVQARLDQRAGLSPYLEDNKLTQKALSEIDRSSNLLGLPEAVAADLLPKTEAIKSAFEDELNTFALNMDPNQSPVAKNEAVREFLRARVPDVKKEMADISADFRARRKESDAKMSEAWSKSIDPFKKGAVDPSLYTSEELEQRKQISAQKGNRTRFLEDRSYQEAATALDTAIAEKMKTVSPEDTIQQQLALRQQFAQEYTTALDGILEKNLPSEVPAKINEYLNAAVPDFMSRVGDNRIEVFKRGLSPGGKGAEATTKALQVQTDAIAISDKARVADPETRAQLLTQNRKAEVPPDTYDMLETYLSGGTGFAGMSNQITRAQMQDHLAYQGRRLLTDLTIDPKKKGEAAVSMYAPFLIPAKEALADQLVPRASVNWEFNMRRQLEQARMVAQVQPVAPEAERNLRALEVQASAKPVPISLKGVAIPLATTRFFASPSEVNDADIRALAIKYDWPPGAESLKKLRAIQLTLASEDPNAR